MDIFIGNLPGTATLVELTEFLQGIDLRTHFQCHEGYDKSARNYHFVVARTPTPEEGQALIGRLNGRLFEGHQVEAREYLPRRAARDWGETDRRINHRHSARPAPDRPGNALVQTHSR